MHPFDLHEQVQGIAFLVLDNQMQHNWTETESMSSETSCRPANLAPELSRDYRERPRFYRPRLVNHFALFSP